MTTPSTSSTPAASSSSTAPDAPDSFAAMPHLGRAQAWVDAAKAAPTDDRRSECWAEAAYAFAEAGARDTAIECLDALLAIEEPKLRAAQRGVDAATLVGELGRALRLYTWVLPSISLDEKRASTAITLADEASKLNDRALERFFLREAMGVQRSEELLARFAQSAVLSAREESGLDDDERAQAVLSLVHLARRHQGQTGYAYAASALELDPRSDDALDLFVDRGIEAKLNESVRTKLEAALFVLGSDRQARALGRLEASLDDRPTGALPEAPSSTSSIVDVDELEQPDAHPRDPRVDVLLAEATSFKSFPSLHVAKLREVLVLDPLEAEALGEMRAILESRGDHEGLRDVLVEASDAAKTRGWPVTKRLPIVRELAELCAGPLDDPFGAIDALEELVRTDAKNADARSALRGHLERVGRWDAVVRLVEESLPTAANPAEVLAELARLQLDKRRDPSAAGAVLLRRAQLLTTDAAAWREVLHVVRPLRDRPRLESVLVDALAAIGAALTTTERASLSEELANLRRASGDVSGAEKLFADAALATRDARLFAAAEACAIELGASERAARSALAQADLADERARSTHLVRAATHFAKSGSRKLALATLRDAVGAGCDVSVLRNVVLACASGDNGETFDWATTLALRTTKDRAAWLALAEELAPGHEQSPRALPLVKELLRLGPTPARLRLLAPVAWSSDDELRALVEGVATRSDVPQALRMEAALLSAGALRSRGDRDGALRVLRTLPQPFDGRVVRELLDLGAGLLGPQEELDLVEQALSSTTDDASENKSWLERAVTLAHARNDAPRELRYVLALLDLDADDFDRVAQATALARSTGDVAVLDRCLAKAIDVEADDETLEGLVRERALLLGGRLGRAHDAATLVAPHAAANPELRTLWVQMASKAGNIQEAAVTLASFAGLEPAEEALHDWLSELPSNEAWLSLALAAQRAGHATSRRILALALARGDADIARKVFEPIGPSPDAAEALSEARSLSALGLGREAFASVDAHAGAPASERPAEWLTFALSIAPTPEQAVALLRRTQGLPAAAFHDALAQVLRTVDGEGRDALVSILEAAGDALDAERLANHTTDGRVAEALARLGGARGLPTHRAIVAALERLGADGSLRIMALAALIAAHPEVAQEANLTAELDRVTVLQRALEHASGPGSEAIGVALVDALVAATRLEEAQAVAQTLVDGSPVHRELLEHILESRGLVHELVASLEKRWSLEKDTPRRIAIARHIAESLEDASGDPREVADAWRRVLRLDPKDGEATAALERAKSRSLGSVPRASAPPPPSSARVSVRAIPAMPIVEVTPLPVTPPALDVATAESAPATENAAPAPSAPIALTSFLAATMAPASEGSSEDGAPHVDAAAAVPNAPTSVLDLSEVEDAGGDELEDAAALDLTRTAADLPASDVPEALPSGDLLDDSLLESMPDAEEMG